MISRRDGTVKLNGTEFDEGKERYFFSSPAGRDGEYFFPSKIFVFDGGMGRKFSYYYSAGRDGTYFFSTEREGKYIYIFLLSFCKVGAIIREDFPALLVA